MGWMSAISFGMAGRHKKPGAAAPVAPPPSSLAGGTPTPPIVDPSLDNAAAMLSSEKARKRAALGGMAMRPMKQMGAAATPKPKSLIGGY